MAEQTITSIQFSVLNGILNLLDTTYEDLAGEIYKQVPPQRKLCQEDAALIITYGCGTLTEPRKSGYFKII